MTIRLTTGRSKIGRPPIGQPSASPPRALRLAGCVLLLAALAACSSQRTAQNPTTEAAQYAARARGNYTPPGPPGDPWGPYIVKAAERYDVPERWVREVVRQESGGRLYENGRLITSSAGAMGLMQVMPATYDELRGRYPELGEDPFDPHDNIMAGTAYLRELYDMYGSPGFLAAYNAGPGRLDDYLTRNRGLPNETRRYVARIGANLGDAQPRRVAEPPQYAMLPINIPAGPRYPRGRGMPAPVALAANRPAPSGYGRVAVQTASLVPPPAPVAMAAPVQVAAAAPPKRGFHLIAPAMADTAPAWRGGPATGGWAIQVGAYASESQARAATDSAKRQASDTLAAARPMVGSVRQGSGTLYRARLTGLSHNAATAACEKIARGRNACIVISPDAQS